MPSLRKAAALAALALLPFAAACGDDDDDAATTPADGTAPSAPADDVTVVLRDISFQPGRSSLPAGTTVVWRFEDKGIAHNVTADDGSFKSETKDAGTFEHTFDRKGTVTYTCTVHPDTMKGTIEVR